MAEVIRIHPDRIVTPRDYDDVPKHMMKVMNQFYTLQGEGQWAGWPAYFIRTAGCNYGDKVKHCGGVGLSCDTDFEFGKGENIHVMTLVENACKTKARVVVMTGGEPMLQADKVIELSQLITSWGLAFQVETNGVYLKEIERLLEEDDADVVISPKAHQDHGYNRNHMQRIVDLIETYDDSYLKLLISDYPYNEIPPEVFQLRRGHSRVFLSPVTVYADSYEGEIGNSWDPKLVNQKETATNHARVAALCMEHGFRMSMQMHNFVNIP